MKQNRLLLFLAGLVFIILILLFPSIAVEGSRQGLSLWFQILVPTLLPFFILAALLRTLFPTKQGTLLFLGIGLFSGYPIGASIVAREYTEGRISNRQAYFCLNLCNQASPMFLLIFVGVQVLHLGVTRYFFFFLILLASLMSSLCFYFFHSEKDYFCQGKACLSRSDYTSLSKEIDYILLSSLENILKIGCYVILFSILAAFMNVVFSDFTPLCIGVTGFFEITTGMLELGNASLPYQEKIVLASLLSAFGGLSALAQTKTVIGETGLSLKKYLFHKALSAFFATVLSILFCFL